MINEIITLKYGESVLSEAMIFRGGSADKTRPIDFTVYLIKSDDHLILVDAGCVTMPGFDMKNFSGSIKALKDKGFSPCDITDLIITHAHHDHIECAGCFKNAAVYIQKDEYAAGKDYLRENCDIRVFDEQTEVCRGVRAVKIGGHSIGSCIVEVESNREKSVIVGDEIYIKECLEREIPTGASCNEKASEDFIKLLRTRYSDYNILFCHDKSR